MQLPELGIPWIKAKLDTGAQTSSIHAHDVVEFERDGMPWVRFRVRPWQRSATDEVEVERPLLDRRRVRSSNGQVQNRLVVELPIVLVGRTITAQFTLTNRDRMGFRMLIGREALERGFVVFSGESFLGERAPRSARRRNKGRED